MFSLLNYKEYLEKHPFYKKVGIENLSDYGSLETKQERSPFYNVNPNLEEAFPAELDDLIRLHYLVTSRKVTTILEFGVGKSSIVFDDALEVNKIEHTDYVKNNLRRTNIFECHSIDNNEKWIEAVKEMQNTNNVTYYHSKVRMSTFNDRICTMYDNIPNICPDLIYLDAPDLFSVEGDIRGISTSHTDRLPMSGDILSFEHFLLPGTLIVVDGRTANARFLKSNLQRNWVYSYYKEYDQHFFELIEEPLGIYNKRQIDYCLGSNFYNQL